MTLSDTLDILKEAILLERRGQAFYRHVAAGTAKSAVRDFFETMAEEEQRHAEILAVQYRAYDQTRTFETFDPTSNGATALADLVLTPELKGQIAGAGFEAAAISAAIMMEEKAVDLYSQRARSAQGADERCLYQWLADWEKSHLQFLVQLDKDIRQDIWNDAGFWPF